MKNFIIHTPTYTIIDVDGHTRDAWEFKCENMDFGDENGIVTLVDATITQLAIDIKLEEGQINGTIEDTQGLQWLLELVYINPDTPITYRIFEPIN